MILQSKPQVYLDASAKTSNNLAEAFMTPNHLPFHWGTSCQEHLD